MVAVSDWTRRWSPANTTYQYDHSSGLSVFRLLTCLRGAFPPVLLRAVCFVRAIVVSVAFG